MDMSNILDSFYHAKFKYRKRQKGDRAFNASSNTSDVGGIFRNHKGDFVFGFARTIERNYLFFAEVSVVMKCMVFAIHWS